MAETDSSEILQECIKAVKKNGRIGLIGDYFGFCNQFPIGAYMEKSLEMKGGQAHVQNYWPVLLPLIQAGKIDSTFLFTHVMPLDKVAEGQRANGAASVRRVSLARSPRGWPWQHDGLAADECMLCAPGPAPLQATKCSASARMTASRSCSPLASRGRSCATWVRHASRQQQRMPHACVQRLVVRRRRHFLQLCSQ
jgi:hypothetical protein